MRIVLATLAILIVIPTAEGATAKAKTQCKNACSSSYTLCMKRSSTPAAKKYCRRQNKSCKKGCKG